MSDSSHSLGVQDDVAAREQAAHDKRNWVRLTFDCNDHCIFCLDSRAHDGEMRDPEQVKAQILDGRRKGATRLILSGGEPTIHPRFVDFVKLGRLAGYPKIQTVTNGRMFAYKEFLTQSIDQGLGEITFSIHGHNAKVHDALVGVPGAFEEEVQGLKHALNDGRVIVNIDVCVNRANVPHLSTLIETFVAMGVREYDLLHIIPFGRAYTDGKDTLFYDLHEMQPHLREAFSWARKPDMHIWLNRFPPPHCEGFEDLIQDPYKLNDEVRGRQEEYELLLESGTPLHCRNPRQCGYCYLEPLCDSLDDARVTVAGSFDEIRIDVNWESQLPPSYGGDPASAKRIRLPMANAGQGSPKLLPPQLAEAGGATLVDITARDVAGARATAQTFDPNMDVALDVDDYAGLPAALVDDHLDGRRLRRVVARGEAQARELLAIDADFEVVVLLDVDVRDWLLSIDEATPRLVVRQPNYDRSSEAAAKDVDLAEFCSALDQRIPVENVAPCILGRAPRPRPSRADTAMMRPDGRLEIFRFAKRFISEGFYSRPLRCDNCHYADSCAGMHINYIRAHTFAAMKPLTGPVD